MSRYKMLLLSLLTKYMEKMKHARTIKITIIYFFYLNKLFIDLQCTITSKINGTQRCLHAHFEATIDFSRSEFTCP